MAKYLFRSRWIALIWALSLCFTISRFFDEGGGQEKLAAAAQDIRAQRMARSQQAATEQEYVEAGADMTMETEPEAAEPY